MTEEKPGSIKWFVFILSVSILAGFGLTAGFNLYFDLRGILGHLLKGIIS